MLKNTNNQCLLGGDLVKGLGTPEFGDCSDATAWWSWDSDKSTLNTSAPYKQSTQGLVQNDKGELITAYSSCGVGDLTCKRYSGLYTPTDFQALTLTKDNVEGSPGTCYDFSTSPVKTTICGSKGAEITSTLFTESKGFPKLYETCNPTCFGDQRQPGVPALSPSQSNLPITSGTGVKCVRSGSSSSYSAGNMPACCSGDNTTTEKVVLIKIPVVGWYYWNYRKVTGGPFLFGPNNHDAQDTMLAFQLQKDPFGAIKHLPAFDDKSPVYFSVPGKDPMTLKMSYLNGKISANGGQNVYDVTYSWNYNDYFCCSLKNSDHYANAGSGWFSEVTVYQLRTVMDGTKCAADWCPWSETCRNAPDVSNQIFKYCGGLDENGNPRLNTDPNCADWCGPGTRPKGGQMCGDIAADFCKIYKNHPACGCIEYEDTKAFSEIQSLFEAVPGSAVELHPVCWAPECTIGSGGVHPSDNRAVLNNAQRVGEESCKGATINICDQIINVLKTNGNVTISNNTFEQTCGEALPHFGHTPGESPPQGGGGGSHKIEVYIAIFVGIFLLFMLVRELTATKSAAPPKFVAPPKAV
jgi:hypothetical protein